MILVLITYAQKPPLNTHADVIIGVKFLNSGSSLHLHPYYAYANNEGSGESAHLRSLARVFVDWQYDMY